MPQKRNGKKELGISNIQVSLVPFGETFNYNDKFDKEELIKPKSKSKKMHKETHAKLGVNSATNVA